MTRPLAILVLEDNPDDLQMLLDTLAKEAIQHESVCLDSGADFIAALQNARFDLILSDYSLPSFDGPAALRIAREKAPDTPFIFVTGTIGEELAIETIRSGATDYVLKDRLSRLAPAVRRAISEVDERVKREEAERARAEAWEMERTLLEASPDATLVVSADGTLKRVNRQAETMFGYTREQLADQNFRVLLPSRYSDTPLKHLTSYTAVLSGPGDGVGMDLVGLRKSGEEFPIAVALSPAATKQGEIFIATIRDMTERKRIEDELARRAHDLASSNQRLLETLEALERSKEKAEEATRLKSQFLTNISHEIRTPMNGIIGMTEIMLDSDLAEDQRECLETVRDAAGSLLAIINDILDFSKIEAGKVALDPAPFEIRELVAQTLKPLILSARRKNIGFKYGVRTEVPDTVVTNQHRLRQVLTNIVANAVKFTTRGEISVGVGYRNQVLSFSVSDTGIGIAADQQTRIFDAFVQADGSLTRPFGGAGLGLAISSHLVRLLGGEISLKSTLGQGSTFHFTVETRLTAQADTHVTRAVSNSHS